MNMATFMEDMDNESGSQNELQGVDVVDPAHEKEGTMVTLQRPGTPGEVHTVAGCSYTLSIAVAKC